MPLKSAGEMTEAHRLDTHNASWDYFNDIRSDLAEPRRNTYQRGDLKSNELIQKGSPNCQ